METMRRISTETAASTEARDQPELATGEIAGSQLGTLKAKSYSAISTFVTGAPLNMGQQPKTVMDAELRTE